MTNYLKTGLLLTFMTFLFMGIGFMIGGQIGMAIAFVVALGMNFFSYYNSDKMLLSMHGAHQIGPNESGAYGRYYRMIEDLAQRAELPMPKVYIMENDQPNAFATGRSPDHAAVAATTGILQMLSERELRGVMAHELAHVKNRDMLIMTMTATIAGAIGLLANFAMMFRGGGGQRPNFIVTLAIMFLAPIAASLVQMAISRTREYQADKMGAEISGDPLALAEALNKISGAAHEIPNETAEANPATAHLFIVNPLTGRSIDKLFSTHPNTENRIAALVDMSDQMKASGVSPNTSSGDRYSRPSDYFAGAGSSSHSNEREYGSPQRSDTSANRSSDRISGRSADPWGSRVTDDNHQDRDDNHQQSTGENRNPWGTAEGNSGSADTPSHTPSHTPDNSRSPGKKKNPWG